MPGSERVGKVKGAWLRLISRTLNKATSRAALSGRGPFSLIEHTGRRSGRTYQTPVITGRAEGGVVVELTYGSQVQWYRNVVAAGGCVVVHGTHRWRVGAPVPLDVREGLAAFTPFRRVVLRVLRRHEFRYLPLLPPPAG